MNDIPFPRPTSNGMEERAKESVAFSHMATLAGLSVAVLLGGGTWQIYQTLEGGGRILSATNPSAKTNLYASTPFGNVNWQAPVSDAEDDPSSFARASEDKDGISNIGENVVDTLIGSYAALAESGAYTAEAGEQLAEDIGASLRANVSYPTYSVDDLKTDTDISYERMLAYRNDLRIALEPLLKNPGYELSIFANYIESRDALYLEQLRMAAENYREAVERTANVVVPEDALSQHAGILNALSEFGATVERLAEHADDAFASAALLRTYDASELRLFTSFDTLAMYQKSKTP